MAVATTPSTTNTDPYTIDIINLNNLLTRLEQNILTSSSSAEYKLLQQSHLHRARIGANIDYAQTLLNNIDRSLPAVKSPATRHERTTDLAKKRARWVNVKERFDLVVEDIERRSHEYNDDDVNEEEEEEVVEDDGIWEGINPVSERKSDAEVVAEAEVEADVQTENDNIIPEQTTTTLRQRHGHDTTTTTTTTTPSTTTTTTAAITASGTSTLPKPSPATKTTIATKPELESPNNTKEATLSTHRAEQESLTTSLLTLAGQLKASSEAFQASLEHEKGILNRAVEGLDRNISGMDAAGKRMGVLRRMSEGRGWWGRMMMYLWIFGLWIVALAIVYLGPKLRF